MHPTRRSLLVAVLSTLFFALPVPAKDFPPITDAERQLTEVPGHPGATAVVLFEKAEIFIMDYPSDPSTSMDVHVRMKILNEEGLEEHGEVRVLHSRFLRMRDFEGRTVLPDGREVSLDETNVFRERSSQREKLFVTKAAFPALEVGAIVEYRYTLYWDWIHIVQPWYFNNDVPTLLSEVTYYKPERMGITPYGRAPKSSPIQSSNEKTSRGMAIRVWMENPPPIPDEPVGFPPEDLSSFFVAVPKEVVMGTRVPILDKWETVCDAFEDEVYGRARKGGKAKSKAKELAASAGDTRAKVEAIYRFVRDEIRLVDGSSIVPSQGTSADKVLTTGEGSAPDQALLLQAMLEAIKVKSRLVWGTWRSSGRPVLDVINLGWFDTTLVEVALDGGKVYLHPADSRGAFGRLSPQLAGTQALVHDKKSPEEITLPDVAFDTNRRAARLEMSVDDEGRLSGRGTLELAGYHARAKLKVRDTDDETVEYWEEWLEDNAEGYAASDVEVEESIDDQAVRVSFALAQKEDEVLGDEAEIHPSIPLGPVTQVFSLPPEKRLTPVHLSIADRDDVELVLTWPEGWDVDLTPQPVDFASGAGMLLVSVDVDEAERRLTFKRRLDITQTDFFGPAAYQQIRDLYAETEKSDAQTVVLVGE